MVFKSQGKSAECRVQCFMTFGIGSVDSGVVRVVVAAQYG